MSGHIAFLVSIQVLLQHPLKCNDESDLPLVMLLFRKKLSVNIYM